MTEQPDAPPKKPRIERRKDWTLRPGTAEDEPAILDLLNAEVWHRDNAREVYDWKFRDNPEGPGYWSLAVNEAQELAAVFAFMPWRLVMGGETFGASQMVDAFTSVPYRGQGIVLKQMNAGLADLYKQGRPVCFAFPNKQMAPGHKINKATLIGWTRRYSRPLRTAYLIQRKIKDRLLANLLAVPVDFALRLASREAWTRMPGGARMEAVTRCGPEFDELTGRMARALPARLMPHKTAAYLTWKYAASPNPARKLFALRKGEELLGWIVIETGRKTGNIVDAGCETREQFDAMTAWAIRRLRREGCEVAVFKALDGHPFIDWLAPFRFVQREDKNHFYVYVDPEHPLRETLLDPGRWTIVNGDSDLLAS